MATFGFTLVMLIAVSIVMIQLTTARQRRQAQESSTIKTLVNLPLNELIIIYKARHGEIVEPPKNMTPCARAILSCCEGQKMNEYCSDSLKCGSYFFDDNPCEDKFIRDALRNAKYFYEQFSEDNVVG